MLKKFKFKLEKKSVKLKVEKIVKKLTLKFIGLYGNKKMKFTSCVSIKFKKDGKIKKIYITDLDVNDCSSDQSKNEHMKSYLICSSKSSTSSYSSHSNIYDEIKSFINGIKFLSIDNKLSSIIFSLKNTNIRKIKVKGKLN
jgi:hypothetical protein